MSNEEDACVCKEKLNAPPLTPIMVSPDYSPNTDLCKQCHEKQLVMPACESFELRIKNPKMYFVFYTYFYSAVIGGTAWKRQVEDEETLHLGNVSSEAFGHILLLNNYKAWLHVAKTQEGWTSMKTEYDPPDEIIDKQGLADYLLSEWEFDITATETDDLESYMVSEAMYSEGYKRLKVRRLALEKLGHERLAAAVLTAGDDSDEGGADAEEGIDDNEVRPSKRKRMLQLKKYTSKNDGKKLFGGWAPEAQKKMMEIGSGIKADVEDGKYAIFVKAYLDWKRSRPEYNTSGKQNKENDGSDGETVVIRRDILWDL